MSRNKLALFALVLLIVATIVAFGVVGVSAGDPGGGGWGGGPPPTVIASFLL